MSASFRTYCLLIALTFSLCLWGQESVPKEEKALTVAERNALQGFNDTIDRLADDFVEAYVVIADPGDVLYSILGHACLHLRCSAFGLDYIFSYESESVQGKVVRFLMNDLKMGMVPIPIEEFLQPYEEEGRGVKEYKLNLPPAVKSELWRICDERVTQGMNLQYDYIKRGCAISIVHALEEAIQSANQSGRTQFTILYPPRDGAFDRTLREIFYDNAPHGWGLFWCMTLVGGQVDNPHLPDKEKLICPAELASIWQEATMEGKNVLGPPTELLHAQKAFTADTFSPLYASLIVLLLAIAGLFWKRPYLDWIILAIQTLLGCLMLWLLISPLPGSEWSWLIIPFNPLAFLCWKWRKQWSLWYAIVIVGWCIGMLCAPHRLVEYAHILLALAFCLVLVKQHWRAKA